MTAALVLVALVPAATAGADPILDKRADAAALTAKLNEQARRIVSLDVQYRQAQRELGEAEAAVAQTEAEVAAATRRQDELKRLLVATAQTAYVNGGSVSMLRYLMVFDGGDPVARRAYLRLLTGHDRRLIDDLRATREDLEVLLGRLDAARRRAGAQADAIGTDRNELERAIRVQRANLAAVNEELARLVAAEQARLAEEAARAAAARAAAAAPKPTPTTRGAAAPAPAPAARSPVPNPDAWACIRQLESGNNYASPGGGAYQFLDSTWQSLGYSGTASSAPPAVQDEAAVKLQARSGWGQWAVAPLCGLL